MDNTNKKKIIILIVALVIIIIAIIIINIFLNSINSKIKQVLKNYNFTYSEKKYEKQKSVLSMDEYNKNYENGIDAYYETLNFYIKNYQLRKIIRDYNNGLETSFFLTYDYKEELLSYVFEVDYNSNYYTFEGHLTEDEQNKCNAIDDDDELTSDEENTICLTVNNIVLDFQNEADSLFDGRLKGKMKK